MRAGSENTSTQGDLVCRKQRRKLLAAEKSVFAFALPRQRIKADQDVIHQPRVTHDHATVGRALQKSLHERREIGLSGKIIGSPEARIERDLGARGAAAELRAQEVEKQGLGRAEAIEQGLIARALANPGLWRC